MTPVPDWDQTAASVPSLPMPSHLLARRGLSNKRGEGSADLAIDVHNNIYYNYVHSSISDSADGEGGDSNAGAAAVGVGAGTAAGAGGGGGGSSKPSRTYYSKARSQLKLETGPTSGGDSDDLASSRLEASPRSKVRAYVPLSGPLTAPGKLLQVFGSPPRTPSYIDFPSATPPSYMPSYMVPGVELPSPTTPPGELTPPGARSYPELFGAIPSLIYADQLAALDQDDRDSSDDVSAGDSASAAAAAAHMKRPPAPKPSPHAGGGKNRGQVAGQQGPQSASSWHRRASWTWRQVLSQSVGAPLEEVQEVEEEADVAAAPALNDGAALIDPSSKRDKEEERERHERGLPRTLGKAASTSALESAGANAEPLWELSPGLRKSSSMSAQDVKLARLAAAGTTAAEAAGRAEGGGRGFTSGPIVAPHLAPLATTSSDPLPESAWSKTRQLSAHDLDELEAARIRLKLAAWDVMEAQQKARALAPAANRADQEPGKYRVSKSGYIPGAYRKPAPLEPSKPPPSTKLVPQRSVSKSFDGQIAPTLGAPAPGSGSKSGPRRPTKWPFMTLRHALLKRFQ
eukprot:jgi/Mesen1/2821/ME000172S01973